MSQKILVVDDDKKIVRLIRAYLEQAYFQILIAYDGETALHLIRSERPDLVVLDLMLPDRDGWDIIRLLRSEMEFVSLPVIMLTARVEDSDKILGLELGADDYITKPFNPREVVARVRAVLRRGQSDMSPLRPRLQYEDLRLDTDSHVVTLAGEMVDVTPMEFDILTVLMKHPGRAFTRAELIELGLGYSYLGLDRAIDTHIKNLRRKIEPDDGQTFYIQTVYGVGYRLGDANG